MPNREIQVERLDVQVEPAVEGELRRVREMWRNVWLEQMDAPDPNRFRILEGEPKPVPNPNRKTGEELFHLILSGIREIYDVHAVIAGGAVRDYVAGNSDVKDVDVFVPMFWDQFNERQDELGWSVPATKIRTGKYEKNKENTCVVPSTARAQANVQGTTVDLVFMEAPLNAETVNQFPIYAQRGIWTLENGLDLSPLAKKDISNKTFTIDPERFKDKQAIEKIEAKALEWKKRPFYKDWTIVKPEIKDWWED